MIQAYLGIDVGSVTTKFVLLDGSDVLMDSLYLPTEGKPIEVVQEGLRQIRRQLPDDAAIRGVATTGSARYLAGIIVGADLIKNEITCHAVGTLQYIPEAQTIIEIGGQDSKIIIIRNGIVTDFGMNTVCAAGTGSFLDHQALRLNMSQEEFAKRALASNEPVHIAGRCAVFAESDMIHKQQMGHRTDDIVYGLCQALVRNYLHNVGAGRDIQAPVVFQGGVAFNQGIMRALQEELKTEVVVAPHHEVMGAIGAALLVHEEIAKTNNASRFNGFDITEARYDISSFKCNACPNLCEIEQISTNGGKVLARWGGRCELWDEKITAN